MTGARPRLVALAALALVAIGGCGDDDAGDGEQPERASAATELLDRLPGDEEYPGVTVVDLDAAREALGLPATADAGEIPGGAEPELLRLVSAAGHAIAYLASPYDSPLKEAIDAGRISAAASTALDFGPQAVTVIATDQPFEEIASSLDRSGWERSGDVLALPEGEETVRVGASDVAGGDGVVVLGFDPALVGSVAKGEVDPGNGLERELAAELDAPAVAALATDADCLRGLAVANELDGEGELVIVADDPDPSRFTFDESDALPFRGFEFEEPEVDGDRLRVRFAVPAEGFADPLAVVGGELTAGQVYDCG